MGLKFVRFSWACNFRPKRTLYGHGLKPHDKGSVNSNAWHRGGVEFFSFQKMFVPHQNWPKYLNPIKILRKMLASPLSSHKGFCIVRVTYNINRNSRALQCVINIQCKISNGRKLEYVSHIKCTNSRKRILQVAGNTHLKESNKRILQETWRKECKKSEPHAMQKQSKLDSRTL